jgi:hypothetical protein
MEHCLGFRLRGRIAKTGVGGKTGARLIDPGSPIVYTERMENDENSPNPSQREAEERRRRAVTAVAEIQRRSVELGLDQMSLEEIEAEIAAVRRERRRRRENEKT